jgi:uncharacterized membrane protein
MQNLWGHSVLGLVWDVWLAILAPLQMLIFAKVLRKLSWGTIWLVPAALWVLFIMPNALYLVTELRHAIPPDGVIKGEMIPTILFYSVVGLFGLTCAVITNLIAVHDIAFLQPNRFLSLVVLSCLSAAGTVIGVLGYVSTTGFLLPIVIGDIVRRVWQDIQLLYLFIGLAVLLSILSLGADRLFVQQSSKNLNADCD